MNRIAFVLSVALPVACIFAQATSPTTNAPVEHLKVKVTGVEGLVQVREAEDQPWKKATEGMEVGEDAEFRTGPKSAVRFTIPPDQTITLDRLGTVKVLRAIEQNGKITTNLGMKYGRTRYDIEAAGREHEASIASPSSTLAIRGTKVSLTDQRPFPAQAVSLTGRAEFRDFKKRTFFGNKNAGTTVVNTETASAASNALTQSVVDPSIALARSRSETALVNNLLSQGATTTLDFERGIRVVTGGSHPMTDKTLIPNLPGTLNFVLRWDISADLNLTVIEPGNGKGHTVYPLAGYNNIKSGGSIAFDHRGGSQGGIEIVSWPASAFPDGRYSVGAQWMNGPASVPATLDVYLNGQHVPILDRNGNLVQQVTENVTPPRPDLGITGTGLGRVDITKATPKKMTVAAKKRAAIATPTRAKR